ncbi:MAG: XRE family transcriptional regulator [Blastopirellula sp.]|nr:MAG: XRE family transcriptional regulator [Blastopirellula sp.]
MVSSPTQSIFSQRLKKMRELRKFNQEQLADKAGLPSTAVSHFESGARKPSFENLRKLADALEVSIDYLMGRVNETTGEKPYEAEIFRDYENLTDQDRELARDFMASLAKRNAS